jgi:molybdate-binding protein
MKNFQPIKDLHIHKILADETRQRILRILMSQPATLSQIGKELNVHPAKVRHHLKRLEEASLVELTATNVVRGFVEKYYQASAKAYYVNYLIVPTQPEKETIVATGSHDIALEYLASSLCRDRRTPDFMAVPLGSLDGLIALRQGLGQVAGCHLFDPVTKEYNLPYVRLLFPNKNVRVITFVHRQQGLIMAPGNPKGITGLDDLASPEVRFINRQPGSGTRLWFDQQLSRQDLQSQQISGYDREVRTHRQVADEVLAGRADVGLGLQAVAIQKELDFIPLFSERYDLVIPEEQYQDPNLQPVFETLQSKKFRQAIECLGGYETGSLGVEISI